MKIRKYYSYTIKTRNWDKIEAYYEDLNNYGYCHSPFSELVRYIRSTSISERLYATTSLDRLIISIYSPIEPNREALRIDFNRTNQQWHFEYHSKPYEHVGFIRDYPAEQGIEKFDNFIRMIKW